VIEALRDEQPEGLSPARTADGLTVRRLTKYNALVTYHTVSRISTTGEKRRTLRSSIWKRIGGRWLSSGNAHGRFSGLDTAIGAEKTIPEEIDHREIAVPMAVVDEMELLLSSEPGKAAKP
jgi:hypothetical protein